MAFVNNYTPPEYPADLYGPKPWDINFVFPIPPAIENDVVGLIPFIPRLHADAFWDAAGGSDPELYRYMVRPLHTKDDLLKQLLDKRKSAEACLFLIVDKTKPEVVAEGPGLGGAMAGLICYMGTSATNLCTEIGPIIILKSAQRTHVTTNATGLLMHYALNLPSDLSFPGLGLRRVVWMCNSDNTRSLATAQRLGFRMEGTLRWLVVVAKGSPPIGDAPREGDPIGRRGRHDLMLSLCWDDWEDGGRTAVEKQMARRAS